MIRSVSLLVLGVILAAAPADAGYRRIDAMVPVDPVLGVSLDATLYVPDIAAPAAGFPLIVRQHGGGSNKDSTYDVKYALLAVETGNYAALLYSHRGHGDSGGVFDFFGPESVADFSIVLDWVETAAPEVDTNNVGTNGYSQGGGLSLLPAEHDSRVKAVAVGNTFDSLPHALNPGDCYKFSWANGIFLAAYKSTASRTRDDIAARWGLALTTGTEDVPVPVVGSANDEMLAHSPITFVEALVERRVPVFWSNSWEDQLFPADHPETMMRALEEAGVPAHYWFASGGHAAGPNDVADEEAKEAAMLRWFDWHLRKDRAARRSFRGRHVDYAERVPGTDAEWVLKKAAVWPPSDTEPASFHPHADGSLASSPDEAAEIGQVLNDLANVNVRNDAILNEIARNGPGLGDLVQSIPENGSPLDTRLYTSAPLDADLEFVGTPHLDLAVRSTALTQFQMSAKLWDVAPDGTARMVSRGCISLPGATRTAELPLWPNAHVFAPGHRIALAISAVDFPVFAPDEEPQVTAILRDTRLSLPTIPKEVSE